VEHSARPGAEVDPQARPCDVVCGSFPGSHSVAPCSRIQLRRGLELADRLGAAPIASDLRALARRARIALARPTRIDGDKLAAVVSVTPRERDILSLVVAGRTYGEIARELFISEKTVSTHISHLLDKTRTANRLELAGFVERTLAGNGA
jgi:DNA-binding CsgD family transcriptional regulator